MSTKISQTLVSVSEIDKKLHGLVLEKAGIENKRDTEQSKINEVKSSLVAVEEELQAQNEQKAEEESRLKGEEERISEERKKLTSLAGAKQAKFIERQIDVGGKRLQAIEEKVLRVVDKVEGLESKLYAIREHLAEIEGQFNADNPEDEKVLAKLQKEIDSLSGDRDKGISKLDSRLQSLYRRISGRYPGAAIAVAKNGACRSCFRFLPAQTYNQLLAGNVNIQCPGCGRILIKSPDTGDDTSTAKSKTKKK